MNQLAGAVEAAAAWEVAVAVEGNGAECHLEVEAAGAVWGSEDVFFPAPGHCLSESSFHPNPSQPGYLKSPLCVGTGLHFGLACAKVYVLTN